MNEPQKMKLISMDIAAAKQDQLKSLFPEIFTENKIDFDQLKRILGEWIEPGKERFGLQWPGKAECMKIIQQPSVATLKPCPEESVNFDETENVFIEGDNLEVLKLLQKSYFGKIKMIYIDPPYNTGKEFIYPDKYSETLDTYLAYTGQVDDAGKKFSTNTEAQGRFHSRWLNMMYPRLYLARNLLREDGVIFISIDDHEQANLKLFADLIFGEENFVGTIVWKNATDNNPTNIACEHEYILCYAKTKEALQAEWKALANPVKDQLIKIGEELTNKYKILNELQAAYAEWFSKHKPHLSPLDRYKYIDFDGVYTGSQSVHNPGKEGYRYDVLHPKTGKPCQQPLMGYRFPQETMKKLIDDGKVLFGDDESKIIELKVYAKEYKAKLSSVISIDGRLGAYDVRRVFPEFKKTFDNPKPIDLIKELASFTTGENDIILDFFAGSGTTAHATLDLNQEDQGNRKFILIQLPEKIDDGAKHETIADVCAERIKRVVTSLDKERKGKLDLYGNGKLDLGFKAFKLCSSNFKIWEGNAEKINDIAEQLTLHVDHIGKQSTPEDILYEILLKAGFPLTTKIKKLTMSGKQVFSIEDGAMLICLEKEITPELIDSLAEAEPLQVICLDEAFKSNDQLKANAVQTFKARAQAKESEIIFRTV